MIFLQHTSSTSLSNLSFGSILETNSCNLLLVNKTVSSIPLSNSGGICDGALGTNKWGSTTGLNGCNNGFAGLIKPGRCCKKVAGVVICGETIEDGFAIGIGFLLCYDNK